MIPMRSVLQKSSLLGTHQLASWMTNETN